jgi:hypothetical protein
MTTKGINRVAESIFGQRVDRQRRSFLEEYREFLEEEGINFDDRYLFYEPV